jgi:hypothetical protein
MSTPFQALLNASKNPKNSCDGWHEKLVGKIILNDNEETALSANEVCFLFLNHIVSNSERVIHVYGKIVCS